MILKSLASSEVDSGVIVEIGDMGLGEGDDMGSVWGIVSLGLSLGLGWALGIPAVISSRQPNIPNRG